METHRRIGALVAPIRQSKPRDPAAGLDALAAHAQRALEPVAPSEEFRARLREGLRMAAHHREAPHLLVRPRAETPWGLLVGAAALGSAAGLVALLLRARQGVRGAEQVVTQE